MGVVLVIGWLFQKRKGAEMKMRKAREPILLMLVAATMHVWAGIEPVGDHNWSYSVSGSQAKVTGVAPATGAISIPAYLGGCPVTGIDSYAFNWCQELIGVTIPHGVTSIGYSAFNQCDRLTYVIVPASVTSIEGYAFSGCSGLTEMTIPEGVTYIGSYAFSGCSRLSSVTIPEGVTYIGSYAFSACDGLAGALMIPDGVTYIGKWAFNCCSNLTSVAIPASVTEIGRDVFTGCSGLMSVVVPEGVTLQTTFRSAYQSITNAALQAGATRVVQSMFSGCSGLASVTIPSSVTSIGSSAFASCGALRTVYVDMGDGARVKTLMSGKGADVEQIDFIEVGVLPELGKEATAAEVQAALAGSADGRLQENITDVETYGQYRAWAQRIGTMGAARSANAWVSFAVDSPVPLARAPTDGDLTVTAFEPTVTAGAFAFEVEVAGVEVGAGATESNLKRVFRLEGSATLDPAAFDEGNVAVEFGEQLGGKLRFTVVPTDREAKSFFMRMRVK